MMDKLMHWCVHRAKFKRFAKILAILLTLIIFQENVREAVASNTSSCHNIVCLNGYCQDGRCLCDRGWQGSSCHRCGGRVRLTESSGYITDGVGNYTVEMQCTWLIESNKPNSTIRLQIINLKTECNWDHLYIFDGGSVFSPLLAAYR
ncbi:attractin-like [Centruroides sculpturatus]|uniref:attractin-like n=1 Tax=Centruroides sculpturatus TaxID=218467 RepID=UPI000C6EB214|nr:attractin-like [Centruroides sculpturatus]